MNNTRKVPGNSNKPSSSTSTSSIKKKDTDKKLLQQQKPTTTTTGTKPNLPILTIPKFKSPPSTPQKPTTNIKESITNPNTKSNKNQAPINSLNQQQREYDAMGSGKPSKIPKPSKTFIDSSPLVNKKLRFEPKTNNDDSIFKGSRIPRPKAQTFIHQPPSSPRNINPQPTTSRNNSERNLLNHLPSPFTTSISSTSNQAFYLVSPRHHHSILLPASPSHTIRQTFTSNNSSSNYHSKNLDKIDDFSFMDDVSTMKLFDDDELVFKLRQPTETVHNDRYETLVNQPLIIETPSPKDLSNSEASTSPIKKTPPTSPLLLLSPKKNDSETKPLYSIDHHHHHTLDFIEPIHLTPLSDIMVSETLNLVSDDDHQEVNIINHHHNDIATNNNNNSNTNTTITLNNTTHDGVILITDLPIYMEIYNYAKEGKELDLFKKLIHFSQLSQLLDNNSSNNSSTSSITIVNNNNNINITSTTTTSNGSNSNVNVDDNNNTELSDEVYKKAYQKFLSRGVFAKLIVKEEILTLNSIEPESGNTALHAAINGDHIGTSSLLCKCKRMINQNNDRQNVDLEFLNIDQYNKRKETPLHISVLKNFANVAHLLLQNGSKAFELTDANGNTALQLAAIYEREAISHSICEHGGDVCIMYDDKIERIVTEDKTLEGKTFDRFGFPVTNLQNKWTISTNHGKITEYVSIDIVKQPTLYNELHKRRIKEESRLKKWKEMLKEIREHHEKGDDLYLPKKFKERVRKGIPNEVRGEAWFYLTRAHILKKQNSKLYSDLKQRPLTMKDSKQIDVDIKREFREHRLFAHRYGKYQVILFNILRAYCNYNVKLGYTQGMSSIAAMLLMYLNEEDAFWVFCSIMEGQNYNMQEMYFAGLPGVYKATFVLTNILSKKMKKFMKAFENEDGIGFNSFCTRWYMLNMLTQIHFDIAVLIWDLYLSEGNKVIHSVSMAFIRIFKKNLFKLKYDGIVQTLSKLLDVDFDLERFMRKILVSKIKEKTIRGLETEYDKKH
ncbi:rabGTPase-activating protein [Naegleria gruberi]|uniref:RabGTPase-activating protein n=1 Tax=Naegleria gruberi TaxID=5762 RepID=D2VU33_NAEGR|nr:rabGTPase-activating protein [Naegleria gruberi]EFC39558.1 rabGTPase-activating protein [Naegleria gruberi]|eukprot:XP_002672302.1 rabGTPase-activating protein [Naegleria gruberi strain NEG-M]